MFRHGPVDDTRAKKSPGALRSGLNPTNGGGGGDNRCTGTLLVSALHVSIAMTCCNAARCGFRIETKSTVLAGLIRRNPYDRTGMNDGMHSPAGLAPQVHPVRDGVRQRPVCQYAGDGWSAGRAKPENGGQNLAPRPMGKRFRTGGCTAHDVVLILKPGAAATCVVVR